MSSALVSDFALPLPNVHSAMRRLLICGSAEASAFVEQQLSRTDYELHTVSPQKAFATATQSTPDIVFVELPADHEGTEAGLALARRLRGEAATYALPLVFVFHKDDPATRRAALALGADDYFAVNAPRVEILARLDALLWRVAAGRRSASTVHDQRAEIDNFMLLVEHVRAHTNSKKNGTLALIEMMSETAEAPYGNTFAQAYGYFKLHLRRTDSVAFYGPTTLLAYLPQTAPDSARVYLRRLRSELCEEHQQLRVQFGTASFPADGTEVEDLIERAEVRLTNDDGDERETPVLTLQELTPITLVTNVTPSSIVTSLTHVNNNVKSINTTKSSVAANGNHRSTNGGVTALELPALESHARGDSAAATPARKTSTPTRDPAFLAQIARDKEAFTRAASEAAAEEQELRAQGVPMPRRLLLTVSDPARLAQLNSLVRSAGYEVRTAFAGQQALDLLRIERPEVLLLDYELYEIDGVETIRRLHRQERGRSNIPVVLLIGAEHEAARREAAMLGARSIVTLPYEPAELLRCVRTAVTVN